MKNTQLSRMDILALLVFAVPLTGNAQLSGPRGGPPQEAFDACASLTEGAACSFTSPRGDMTGLCMTGPRGEAQLACASEGRRRSGKVRS